MRAVSISSRRIPDGDSPLDLVAAIEGRRSHRRFTREPLTVEELSTVPYRMEWRYSIAAHKVIALDAGHVCQNLYLAVAAIGCGTCAVAAYHQEQMDGLLGVDGDDEFTLYLAPVGKI